VSDTEGPRPALVTTLAALTVTGGFLDAVSYLGLGHVFTANMTGNIVLVGFAAAGTPGFSVVASLCALAFFVAGAILAGRVDRRIKLHHSLLLSEICFEVVCIAIAAVIVASVTGIGTGWPRYTVIALLSFAMGVRNATVRRMRVEGMTTTVMTSTLTSLASNSALAGGTNPDSRRQLTSVLCMFGGALVGALLLRHVSAAWALGVAAALDLTVAAYFGRQAPLQFGTAH
jgi:uncharacterized membrane protein YoaK (UPF0700 family)